MRPRSEYLPLLACEKAAMVPERTPQKFDGERRDKMLRRARASAAAASSSRLTARPSLFRASRALCDAASEAAEEARKAELLEFLRCASRPIMGKAKARQSAGQKALDLTKQMKNLEDLDLAAVVRLNSAELKKRGVPTQDRKRLLNYADKYAQGYRHDGRLGKHAWKGWLPPYKLDPERMAHTGNRLYNDHVDAASSGPLGMAPPADADADAEVPTVEEAGPAPPPAHVLVAKWAEAQKAADAATAEALRDALAELGLDPQKIRPRV